MCKLNFEREIIINGRADFVMELWHNIINYLLILMLAFYTYSYSLFSFVV